MSAAVPVTVLRPECCLQMAQSRVVMTGAERNVDFWPAVHTLTPEADIVSAMSRKTRDAAR